MLYLTNVGMTGWMCLCFRGGRVDVSLFRGWPGGPDTPRTTHPLGHPHNGETSGCLPVLGVDGWMFTVSDGGGGKTIHYTPLHPPIPHPI
jgi:hypothetical protein